MLRNANHPISTVTYLHDDFLLSDCMRSVLSFELISILAVTAGSRILTRRSCPILLRKTDIVINEIHTGGSVVNSCRCRKILVRMSVKVAIARELS